MNEINTMILLMTIFVVASAMWLVFVYFVTVRVYEITEENLLLSRSIGKRIELLEIHQSEKMENKRQEYDDSLSSEEQIAYFETEKTRFLVEKIQKQRKEIIQLKKDKDNG